MLNVVKFGVLCCRFRGADSVRSLRRRDVYSTVGV